MNRNVKEGDTLGRVTSVVIISAIAFFVIILLGAAILLLFEEQALVNDVRTEIFHPAAASAHSTEILLENSGSF